VLVLVLRLVPRAATRATKRSLKHAQSRRKRRNEGDVARVTECFFSTKSMVYDRPTGG
jgi:hypothetical protein